MRKKRTLIASIIMFVAALIVLVSCSSQSVEKQKLEVIFKNYDNETLYVTYVDEGQSVEYKGKTPEKEGAIFTGWSESLDSITKNTIVTAKFNDGAKEYNVLFVNYDGEVLQSSKQLYNSQPVYNGKTPEKPSSNGKGYVFSGWDKEIKNVTSDQIYIAKFQETDLYMVKYFNDDAFLGFEFVSKFSDAKKVFDIPNIDIEDGRKVFKGWDKDTTNIQSNMDVHAIYDIEYKNVVNFHDANGNILKTYKVYSGESVRYDGPTPTRADTKIGNITYKYSFTSWDKSTDNVTSNMDIYPNFYSVAYNETYINERTKLVNYVNQYGDYSDSFPSNIKVLIVNSEISSTKMNTIILLYNTTNKELYMNYSRIGQDYTDYIELFFPEKNYDKYELKYYTRERISGSEYKDLVTFSSIIDASKFNYNTELNVYDYYYDSIINDPEIKESSIELAKMMLILAITKLGNNYKNVFSMANLGWNI